MDAKALEQHIVICSCVTKTPEVKYHQPWCSYRQVAALKERIEALEEKCDQQDDALQKIKSWCEAYPLDIFPEVTKEEWAEIHRTLKRELGIPLDRIAANNMRHVINGVAALLPGKGE